MFPLDRLREFAAKGVIGSVAATHYSFMARAAWYMASMPTLLPPL
jgi:hypothetical protein